MRYLLFTLLLSTIIVNSQIYDNTQISSQEAEFFNQHFNSSFYENQWVGFSLYDPEGNRVIYDYNGNKYFTPASVTKIFTLYAATKIFSDSIPALKYIVRNDTIFIKGTGDPTLLEPYFKQKSTIDFLKNRKEKIALYLGNFIDPIYAPGWSWDDFSEDFLPERSAFPIYGNVVNIKINKKSVSAVPGYFKSKVMLKKLPYARNFRSNIFYTDRNRMVPFIVSPPLIQKLLEENLTEKVNLVSRFPEGKEQVLYSLPFEDLYKRMITMSDNFLAEQTLLMASEHVFITMNSKSIIQYILKQYLYDLPQVPKWVDGSGLSRYNMITPQDLNHVLALLYAENTQSRLFNIFPAGGINGTISNSYKSKTPYIYAKTGTMTGVHNLSGYIKTNSGKVLVFSYMNNNYSHKVSQLKQKMEELLIYIRDHH